MESLADYHADGLLDYTDVELQVRPAGYPFLRNICMAFDRYLTRNQRTERPFSQTV